MNIYEKITQRIVSELEKGVCPWNKPWRPVDEEGYNNPVTGTVYSGINIMLLSMFSGSDRTKFVTYKQAKKAGGNVKKGEKGLPVVFFKMITKDEGGKWIDAAGTDDEDAERMPVLKGYTVFSIDQCEGLPDDWYETKQPEGLTEHERIKRADDILASFRDKPEIVESLGNRAFYRPADDMVKIPELSQFVNAEEYYKTLFHELAHSTGHKKRLNRDPIASGNQSRDKYGREELIAEMAAAYLTGQSGFFDETAETSAAYLDAWLKTLKQPKNSKMIIIAAAQAIKAAEYIQGRKAATKKAA